MTEEQKTYLDAIKGYVEKIYEHADKFDKVAKSIPGYGICIAVVHDTPGKKEAVTAKIILHGNKRDINHALREVYEEISSD